MIAKIRSKQADHVQEKIKQRLKALAQEQTVTEQIDSLYELAFQEKAFAALVELEWFIKEQVEEEKTAREIVHKFQMVRDDPASLLDMDRELGARSAVELGK